MAHIRLVRAPDGSGQYIRRFRSAREAQEYLARIAQAAEAVRANAQKLDRLRPDGKIGAYRRR